MSAGRMCIAGAGLCLVLLATGFVVAKDGVSLADLRRKLMFAEGDEQVRPALDALSARIGKEPGFRDAGAFGDWLAALPSGRSRLPLVLQRIGWAFVVSKRGPEAIEPLEAALQDDPGAGLTRAYLGEALRQAGRELDALEMDASALTAGYDAPHLGESVLEAAAGLRRSGEAKQATGLPAYAIGLRRVLEARADAALEATLARWLLWDLAQYDRPATERGGLWARTAAEHALDALDRTPKLLAGSQRLAFDAAVALEAAAPDTLTTTGHFDLLTHAVYLGEALAGGGPHLVPQAWTHLAEAAAAEGRFALAERAARKRLEISFSPRAARLARRLPPDLGPD